MSGISVRAHGRSPIKTGSPAWAASVARSLSSPADAAVQSVDGLGQLAQGAAGEVLR
jgi:hypothetical protein